MFYLLSNLLTIMKSITMKRKLFPENQNETTIDEKLASFFDKAKDGSIRMIKVVISDYKILELYDFNETIEKSTWTELYNEIVLNSVDSNHPCFIFYR